MSHAIGIDLGGTKTAAGVVGADGSLLFTDETPTLNRSGPEAILDATERLASRLRSRAASMGITVYALGIGSAGVINAEQGSVISATDAIAGWAGTQIATTLTARLGLPVRVVNDVHAHAMGEAWVGAAAGASSTLMVAFGTGVGGSFISRGEPVLGHRFVGGHVGHFASSYAVDEAGGLLKCSCGHYGHVESIASGPALHAHYLRAGGDPSASDTRQVFDRANTGEPIARAAISYAARAAGQAVGGLGNIMDPEVVVVSGGLADAGHLWWDTMVAAAKDELMPPLSGLRIVPAGLGNKAAIVGAASLVLRREGPKKELPCPAN